MNLFKFLLIALLAIVPLSCKGSGGGGKDKASSKASDVHSDRAMLDGPNSLSAEIIRGEMNNKKLITEIVFQNSGPGTVKLMHDMISIDVNGKTVPARPFSIGGWDKGLTLLPNQVKNKRYGFHYPDFGIDSMPPGRYNLTVRGIMNESGAQVGKDLVVPFNVL